MKLILSATATMKAPHTGMINMHLTVAGSGLTLWPLKNKL